MKYSMFIWGNKNLESRIRMLAGLGYQGIELLGEPDLFSPKKVELLLEEHGLKVSSISLDFPEHLAERDLASPNSTMRSNAVYYVEKCIDFAYQMKAPLVVVVPTTVKPRPTTAVAREWLLAVESVRTVGKYASQYGIKICVEPLNRYRTYLVNSFARARKFVADVGLENVKLMIDCYHMSIEKEAITVAIETYKNHLEHVHASDVDSKGNRKPVGRGLIDFSAILTSLKKISYEGYITIEASTSDYLSIEDGRTNEEYLCRFAAESIQYLRLLDSGIYNS